jgi:hypothetical protein
MTKEEIITSKHSVQIEEKYVLHQYLVLEPGGSASSYLRKRVAKK